MFIAFGLEGLGILALSQFGHDPVMFVAFDRSRVLRLG